MNEGVERLLNESTGGSPNSYISHEILDLKNVPDQRRLEELHESGRIKEVINPIATIALSLFEAYHPEYKGDVGKTEEYINDRRFSGYEYGKWVFYQNGDLVRFPEPEEYRFVRTSRYRDLITEEEQNKLNMGRAAVFGMSVGGNIVGALVRSGLVSAIAIGDMDEVSIANIGRTQFNMDDVGASKVDVVAKTIGRIDPFVEQRHFREGFNKSMAQELKEFSPQVLIDEVDDMVASAEMRIFCRENSLPYVTASDVDRSPVIEICRHDLAPTGLYARGVKDDFAERLMSGSMTEAEHTAAFAKTIGALNLTPKLVESSLQIGETIAGFPQLHSTSIKSAGEVEDVVRNIMLGKNQNTKTGRYRVDTHPRLKQDICFSDWVDMMRKYIKHTFRQEH